MFTGRLKFLIMSLLSVSLVVVTAVGNITFQKPSFTLASLPAIAQSTSTIPQGGLIPWEIRTFVDATTANTRVGASLAWGAYNERSEDADELAYVGQSQELGNLSGGNYAVFNSLDFGAGVNNLSVRIAAASPVSMEVRLGSATGTLAGTCTLPSTGSATVYKTVGCAVDPNILKGVQNLVLRFPSSVAIRLNWFVFWAKNTTVSNVDSLLKRGVSSGTNQPSPVIGIAGTPTRSQSQLPASSDVLAHSFGMWSPSLTKSWECPKWMHDTYWVKVDGKVYPTWHPPIDYNPETSKFCSYGHDHGDDPRGSEAFAIGGMPAFGYINEKYATLNPSAPRHEDHVGHKVFVANNWSMYNFYTNKNDVTPCDVVLKLHMGSHSPDALTNTAHEFFASGQCQGLQPFNYKYMALFGYPGSFKEPQADLCDQGVLSGIPPNPSNQPVGGTHRAIPTKDCFVRGTADLQASQIGKRKLEYWLTGAFNGAYYFRVTNPARYFDQDSSTKIGRMVDLCYVPGHPLAKTLWCEEVLSNPGVISWDSLQSPFRGSISIETHFSSLEFPSMASTTVYTDAWGKNPSTSINSNTGVVFQQLYPSNGFARKVDGQASLFAREDFSANGRNGVHAPN